MLEFQLYVFVFIAPITYRLTSSLIKNTSRPLRLDGLNIKVLKRLFKCQKMIDHFYA